jgi:hypothetical protein
MRCAKALLVSSKEELNAFDDKKATCLLQTGFIHSFRLLPTAHWYRNYIYYNLLFFFYARFSPSGARRYLASRVSITLLHTSDHVGIPTLRIKAI